MSGGVSVRDVDVSTSFLLGEQGGMVEYSNDIKQEGFRIFTFEVDTGLPSA